MAHSAVGKKGSGATSVAAQVETLDLTRGSVRPYREQNFLWVFLHKHHLFPLAL